MKSEEPQMTPTFDGARLRSIRKATGKSREQLAIDIGRSHYSVTGYETGSHTPTMATLMRLSTVLDVPPGLFFSADHDGDRVSA